MNTWKIILATLVIFGAGVVTGGLVVSHALQTAQSAAATPITPWQAQDRELMRRMDRELKLSQSQRERIAKIISESQDRTRSLWKPIAPQMAAERQSVREIIRGELNSEQQKKFDELMKARLHRGEDAAKEWDNKEDRRPKQGRKPPASEAGTNSVVPPDLETTNPPAVKPEPKRL